MRRLTALGSPAAWLRRIARARRGPAVLFCASFLEGVILPLPLEAVLAPYMQLRRDILWRIATVGLAGFVAAALLGYGLGALLYDEVGASFVRAMGWRDEFAEVEAFLADYGFLALILATVTPIPTQAAMIGAGAVGYPLAWFALAMVVARGARYYGLALLVLIYGDRVAARIAGRRSAARADRAAEARPGPP